MRGTRYTPDDREHIRALYRSGLSLRKVSRLAGVSYGAVNSWCQDMLRSKSDQHKGNQPLKILDFRFVKKDADRSSREFKVYTYKGVEYSYSYAHRWMKTNFGKADHCEGEECSGESSTYQWANISGDYKLERSDWKPLCPRCHERFDMTEAKHITDRQSLYRRIAEGRHPRNRPVLQFDRQGVCMAAYASATEAAQLTGISRSNISQNLCGNSLSAGGYIWRHADSQETSS